MKYNDDTTPYMDKLSESTRKQFKLSFKMQILPTKKPIVSSSSRQAFSPKSIKQLKDEDSINSDYFSDEEDGLDHLRSRMEKQKKSDDELYNSTMQEERK